MRDFAERDPIEAPPIGRLLRRADFLRVAKGKRRHETGFTLQSIERQAKQQTTARPDPADDAARIGFTLTKKVGNAVVRNRVRRRLKEATRLGALPVAAGHDYVVVGRIEALHQPFASLQSDLARAVRAIGQAKERRRETTRGQTSDAEPRPQKTERGTGRKP